MKVLLTGPYGTCGTAIIDRLHDDPAYEFTYLNRSDRPESHEYGGYDTVVADVSDYDTIRPAFDDQDAVVHLAGYPDPDSTFGDVIDSNIVGTYNVLEAARAAEVDTVVFGSTNHVMGMYEEEFAPELYSRKHDLVLTHEDPIRPDSHYGASKAYGEALCRYYADAHEYPKQVYVLRICRVIPKGWDHPYGDAERRVQEGKLERGSEAYRQEVRRKKAMWHSRRDFVREIECCLTDDHVDFGIFSGVSDNDRRWFDLEHARTAIGYHPQDNAEEWTEPPD